jgi:hypothetical protein
VLLGGWPSGSPALGAGVLVGGRTVVAGVEGAPSTGGAAPVSPPPLPPPPALPQLPSGAEVLEESSVTSGPGLGNLTSVPSAVEHPLPTLATRIAGRLLKAVLV